MKILEVLDCFYPNLDGPVNVISNLARILNEKGLAEVEILVPDYPKNRVELEGIKIHRAPSVKAPEGYRSAVPFVNGKVKRIIKNGGYDLINCHSCFYLGKYAVKYGKRYGIPTIMTLHTKYKDDFERILKTKGLQKFMLNFIMSSINAADYVSTVSNGAVNVLREYGYKGKEVTVLRNATDLDRCYIDKDKKQAIRQKYGIGKEFVFLFVGRIVENKNIDFSLKTLKALKDGGIKDFKFVIVGNGPYKENLKNTACELGLKENVLFFDKIESRAELAEVYAMSDLFLFPSEFDTCGIVAIEAASVGLASAVLDGTCASELIEHKVNGFKFKKDVDAWKEGLAEIIKREEQESAGIEAQKSVYSNWESATARYFEYYQNVLKEKSE